MKDLRNKAYNLQETLIENAKTMNHGEMNAYKEQAFEIYADLFEQAFEEVIEFVNVDHEHEFLEVIKEVRELLSI